MCVQFAEYLEKSDGQAQGCRECNAFVTSGSVELSVPAPSKEIFYYHPRCFNCKKCGVNLKNGSLMFQHQTQPYCDKCILIVNPKQPIRSLTKDMGFKFT